MLNYEEELKKFKPCLDVDEVEDAIYSRDLTASTRRRSGIFPERSICCGGA